MRNSFSEGGKDMTKEVMKLNAGGVNLVAVEDDSLKGGMRYRVFKRWYGEWGWRRKQIATCPTIVAVLSVAEQCITNRCKYDKV